VLEAIRARFRERGFEELPRPNRRIAQVPRGARKLTNPHGTAPGLAMESGARLVVLLPGIPRELKGIFTTDLRDVLRGHFGDRLRPVYTRSIRTTGIPESLLSQRIGERLGAEGPIRMAFLPDATGVDLRLTAVGMEADEAERGFDEIERELADVLAPWRFEAADGDLVEAVTAALRAVGKTLAVAESCTGGLVAKRMTDLAGASDVFLGGVVAYANEVKTEQLGVDPAELAEHGAVSEVVARRMAEGVARRFGADAGIGITGIAGPGGGTDEKPVGAVWYAAASGGTVVARRERFPGDRHSVRERAAQAALFLLLRVLDGRAGS
jgi:nicotinamide-nucleotide amidase